MCHVLIIIVLSIEPVVSNSACAKPFLRMRSFFFNAIRFYFIPSSDFNAYLKQIKVILSAVKTYRIFFTSDECDLYFFTAANKGYFDNLRLQAAFLNRKFLLIPSLK